jgi:hypothetical protein
MSGEGRRRAVSRAEHQAPSTWSRASRQHASAGPPPGEPTSSGGTRTASRRAAGAAGAPEGSALGRIRVLSKVNQPQRSSPGPPISGPQVAWTTRRGLPGGRRHTVSSAVLHRPPRDFVVHPPACRNQDRHALVPLMDRRHRTPAGSDGRGRTAQSVRGHSAGPRSGSSDLEPAPAGRHPRCGLRPAVVDLGGHRQRRPARRARRARPRVPAPRGDARGRHTRVLRQCPRPAAPRWC